ncbi:MAG TPA: MarC family protein [Rhodopila sp.]|uniref:MarC family protein n=1 Tax=Rhodopila sp. TaxID=2480087 RepID=UPI002C25BB6E|nr:MarC family protein [Rhodopila sp.]HVY17624.1 MarC family protein [Rhodopila sp.]
MNDAVAAFLLGFPALFSIVNPISGALIFRSITATLGHAERRAMARKVAVNSFVVMIGALWAGSYILSFFGISLAALRVAGGIVVALSGWNLLNAPESHEAKREEQLTDASVRPDDPSMFPLTIPITTGPGTISVAVALGASHPKQWPAIGWFHMGLTGAALTLAVIIWVSYAFADRVTAFMGPASIRAVTRLAAFLLLCIGVQILITGVTNVLGPLLGSH